jgi:hypothetical protein
MVHHMAMCAGFAECDAFWAAVYDMVEQLMLRNKVKINCFIRFGYRTAYVLLTTFVAISLVRTHPKACSAVQSAAR